MNNSQSKEEIQKLQVMELDFDLQSCDVEKLQQQLKKLLLKH